MNDLSSAAAIQQAKAREIIGEPGPGIDFIIRPTQPLSDHWQLLPQSSAGRKWIALFWPELVSNRQLPILKADAHDWGLSHYTDWSNIVEQKVD